MNNAAAARVVGLLIVVLVVAMMGFSLASLLLPGTELIDDRPSIVDFLTVMLIVATFPIVGVAIVTKRPTNSIGWLFLLTGLIMAGGTFTTEYADRVASAGANLPGAAVAAWLSSWLWAAGPMITLPLAILLFPDGHPPSRRWGAAAAVAIVLPAVTLTALALAPGPIAGWEAHYSNPVGLPGPAGDMATVFATSGVLGFVAFVAPGGVAIAGTIARIRRSQNTERQQLKWLLYPVAVFVVALGVGILTEQQLAWSIALVGFAGVPVCAGIAILRYRLYDIDLVIRRTLIYGAVVTVLAVVYVGLVLALQAALSGVTGGEALPVALSTLAIAALFGPLRARVRTIVDRRFFRSRYDAQLTLEAFAVPLRDEVDLESVGGSLVATASRAVRPTVATLWLRRPER